MKREIALVLAGRRRLRLVRAAQTPLATLEEDHRRISAHCRTLRALMDFIAAARFDRTAQMTGHLLLRFFDVQVPLHWLDEEEVLFPALIESMAGSDATCIRELTQRSRHLHRQVGTMWGSLRPALLAIAAGHRTLLEQEQVARFSAAWESQIRLEDQELLPMAERLLTPDEAEVIRRQIRERHC